MSTILDQWALWMRAQGLSKRTVTERLATIRRLLDTADTTPLELDETHVLYYLSRKMKPATRATYHGTFRAFCVWMVHAGIRPDNPVERTPVPKRPKSKPRPLTSGQILAAIDAANRQRTRTYILLGFYAGLRVSEIAAVNADLIDRHTNILTMIGKGGKVAQTPLHDVLIAESRRYPRNGWWFPSYNDDREHVSGQAVSAAIGGAFARAGIVGTPHALRHSYGTELVRAGVNLRVVQELMRHESPASTAIYTEVDDTQKRAGIELLTLAG